MKIKKRDYKILINGRNHPGSLSQFFAESYSFIYYNGEINTAQFAGAVEYTDCISAEG